MGLPGSDTPKHSYLLIEKNFVFRSRAEHRRLHVGNIANYFHHVVKQYYIEYTEDASKTRRNS